MKIAMFTDAMFIRRTSNSVQSGAFRTVQRLSSGMRVNSALDDAAGLAISERFTSQIRGLRMGMKNLNDAISLVQTSEGGLTEISGMLQRMRELSVQAASTATVSVADRRMLQLEVSALVEEIDRVAKGTTFNGANLLNATSVSAKSVTSSLAESDLQTALKTSWLQQSENIIDTWFGIKGDASDLTIVFDDAGSLGGSAAWVTSTTFDPTTGLSGGLSLTIDMADFANPSLPDGGTGPLHYDRVIAHEMVHAVMNRTVNMQQLPTWFIEGAAELIHGADERVLSDGGVAAAMAVDVTIWGDEVGANESREYSKAYLAARFINDLMEANGATMKTLFDQLQSNAAGAGGNYFYNALNAAAGLTGANKINNQTQFMTKLAAWGGAGVDLSNTDTGAIGGADASGGTRDTTASGVVPNTQALLENPTNFNIVWPGGGSSSSSSRGGAGKLFMDFQFSSSSGDFLRVDMLSVGSKALEINKLDLVKGSQAAITSLDDAIDYVSLQRAKLGAQQNRLESAINIDETAAGASAAARSRILDTDYATEMAQFSRSQILQKGANAMLANLYVNAELALTLLDQQSEAQYARA